MSELFFSLIGILFLMHGWTAYRRSKLDETRDGLFDLREEVRSHFIKIGRGLNDPLYARTRDYLNALIRFTYEARFMKMVYFNSRINRETQKHFIRSLDASFETGNKDLEKYIKNVRGHAIMIMRGYLLKTSSFAMALCVPLMGLFLVQLVTRKISIKLSEIKLFWNDHLSRQTGFRTVNIEQCAFAIGR